MLLEELGNRFLLAIVGLDFALGVFLAVDLLNDCFLVAHFGHHRVSFLKRLDKSVDSLVELVQVHLHILLLGFEVFWFLIGVEIFKLILIVGIFSLLLRLTILVGNGALSLGAILSFGLVSSGVQVLLLHESVSSLEGSSLDIVSGLREELAQLLQDILGDAHENNVRHWLEVSVLLVLRSMGQGLEQNVGLEIVQDLVVSEVGVFWKVKDWLLLIDFIILVVVNLDETLSDEVHFLDVGFVGDYSLTRGVNSAVHADDELVGKASLALLEEMVERALEFFEDSSVLDQIGLHLRSDLLIELELLNDQVEIIKEGLLDILSDIVVESGLNVEWLVGLLNLLDPHIQRVKFLFDEIVEVIRSVEYTVDGTHEEREERQTHEFQNNGEYVLF